MKASLRFNLPEEDTEFKDSFYGPEWKGVVWELDEKLRNNLKHGDGKMTAQEVRDFLWSEINERGLTLNG